MPARQYQVVLSQKELARVKQEAFSDQALPKRNDYDEKKKLHELSQTAVKRWSNTVLGQRRHRLKALKENADELEKERQKEDAQWAELKQKERQDMVERACRIQFQSEDRVRRLHSQFLLQHVLDERSKQLEYKEAQRAKKAAFDAQFVQKSPFARTQSLELIQAEKRALDMADMIQVIEQQKQERRDRENKLKAEHQSYAAALVSESKRFESKKAEDALKNKREQQKQYAYELDLAVAEKLRRKEVVLAIEQGLYARNANFNEVQEYLNAKRKQVFLNDRQEKEERIHLAAQFLVAEEEAKRKARDTFLQAHQHHSAKVLHGQPSMTSSKVDMKLLKREIEENRIATLIARQNLVLKQDKERLEAKEHNQKLYTTYQKEIETKAAQTRANALEIHAFRQEQAERNKLVKENERKQLEEMHQNRLKRENMEDEAFQQYALSLNVRLNH